MAGRWVEWCLSKRLKKCLGDIATKVDEVFHFTFVWTINRVDTLWGKKAREYISHCYMCTYVLILVDYVCQWPIVLEFLWLILLKWSFTTRFAIDVSVVYVITYILYLATTPVLLEISPQI
jgi:hypothetical protein